MGLTHADTRSSPAVPATRRQLRLGGVDLYLLRGVAGPFAVLLVAVSVALLLERALRLIHELAAAGADIGYFVPLLGQLVPYYLELAIPLAFMLALVLLVARLDERLELEAMLASGLSFTRIAAPLVALGIVLAGAAFFAGGWLEPHGRHGFRTLKAEAINAGRLDALQPLALFQPHGDLAVTFDARTADEGMHGIFLWQRLDGEELVVTGDAGRVGLDRGARLLGVDFAGGRYAVERPGRRPYALDFDQLAFRESMQVRDSAWARGSDPKEMTISELVAEARSGARGHSRRLVEVELYGRIARALLIPLVPLLVLPLAFATKKGGRSLGVVICGVFVALSRHGVGLAKNFAEMGVASPPVLLLGAVGVLAALAAALFVSGRRLPSHSPVHVVLNPVTKAFSRLAPGGEVGFGPRGHGLTSYLSWELGKWTLLALFTLALFLQMIDLVEQGDVFVRRGFGLAEVGRYALLRLPAIVQQAVPLAALAGAMAAFALFASRHEITAMRAVGISQWRMLLKAIAVPVLLASATAALAEWVTPASQLRLATWWVETEPAGEPQSDQPRWFRIDDAIVRASAASSDGARLRDVAIYSRDDQGRLETRVAAAEAAFRDGAWGLRNVETTHYAGGSIERSRAETLPWRASLRPEDAARFFAETPVLSAAAARRTLAQTAPVSLGESVWATRVYRSAAEPVAPLVMLLFALPVAFVVPRTGRTWPAVLYAGGAGLVYLVGDGVLTVAAQTGYLPSLLGAWAAPVLAMLIGLTVLVHSER